MTKAVDLGRKATKQTNNNYLRPSNNSGQLIFNINAVVLIVIIC